MNLPPPAGVGVCLSVCASPCQLEELQPEGHPLWVLAEQFGATCTLRATREVTHVVATALGTEKVIL